MHPFDETVLLETRRQFFGQAARGLGVAALATMLGDRSLLASTAPTAKAIGGLPGLPHFAPKAKRAIYLHMVGAPPQIDLFDYKPKMKDWYDKDLPESVRQGQRLTTMTAAQSRFPIAPSIFKFQQHGKVEPGSRSCCLTRPRWWTTSRSSAQSTPKPSTMNRPSPSFRLET